MVVEWPKFTNIAYSARGRILLNQQRFELKLILRQAIAIIEGKLIFEHSFPDLATRAIWKRKALLKAITHIMNMPTTVAQGSYGTFKSRVREDADYVNDLSKVVRYHRSNKNVEANKQIKRLRHAYRFCAKISKTRPA